MIFGNKTIPVAGYLPIDRNAEGLVFQKPKNGELFFGHPYGFHGENSAPFIEVQKEGQTVRTVNALDCSEIEFMQPAT